MEGRIPLASINEGLHATVGFLYEWKMVNLFITILVLRYKVDAERCIKCNACAENGKMGCDTVKAPTVLSVLAVINVKMYVLQERLNILFRIEKV